MLEFYKIDGTTLASSLAKYTWLDVQVLSLSPWLMPMTKQTTISKAHPQVAKFTYGPGGTYLAVVDCHRAY